MSERPILFSAPMVRAILGGRKTQTRRIVKPQPPADCAPIRVGEFHPTVIDRWGDEAPGASIFGAYDLDGEWGVRCPYGQPGDLLWVREAWARDDEDGCVMYRADVGKGGDADDWERGRVEGAPRYRWRPSIHMPRWASRITLEIVAVRVERLNDISEADAEAEGAGIPLVGHDDDFCRWEFRALWESINDPGSWPANSWVWVIEFKRLPGRRLDGVLHDEYPA